MKEVLVNWKQYPFIRLLLPFLIGLAFGLQQQDGRIGPILVALAIGLIALFYFGLRRSKKVESLLFTGLLFAGLGSLGWINGVTATELRRPDHYSRQLDARLWTGTVQEVQAKARYQQLEVAVQQSSADTVVHWQRVSGKLMVYLPKSDSVVPVPGQKLLFKGKPFPVSPAKNPYVFDYAAYLAGRQVHFQLYLKPGDYQLAAHQAPGKLSRWRHQRLVQLRQIWAEPRHHAIFEAMVFGEKSNLPKALRQLYAEVGALHVLAVSGLHVGIIMVLLQVLFKQIPLFNRHGNLQRLAVLIGVWLYVGLAGAGPSVVRAGTMFSFLLVGGILHRNGNIYNSLAASAFFLLLMQPYWLYSPGFQLSYLAVFGIVHFQQAIYRRWIPASHWLDYVWKLTSVSIAAQVLTFPVSLYYFQQFPLHFWLSGLLIVPLAPLLILLGGMGLLLQQGLPAAVPYFARAVAAFLDGVHFLLEKIQALPGSLIPVPDFDEVEVVGMYMVVLCGMVWMKSRRRSWLYVLVGVLFSLQVWKSAKEWYRQNHPLLIIYAHHEGLLVDMIYQGQVWTKKDQTFPEQSIAFVAAPLRKRYKVKKVELLPEEPLLNTRYFWQIPGCFQFFELRIGNYSVLAEKRPLMTVDILVVDVPVRLTTTALSRLLEQLQAKQIVLAAHLKPWDRHKIKELLKESSLPVHDLQEAGAFLKHAK